MKPNYFFNRFSSRRKIFCPKETSVLHNLYFFLDYLLALALYGTSINDYFAYGFYKLRRSGRNEYITLRRYHKIMKVANDSNDIHICRSKLDFNQFFSDCLGREWIDINETTAEQFTAFAIQHKTFFVKDILSYRGIGVTRHEIKDIENLNSFYNELRAETKSHFIIEEPIVENDELKAFHPWSINTIRVVTLYDTTTDTVHIMNARIRMGNNRNAVDNFHFQDIGANINIVSGIIDSVGYNCDNKTYLTHPISGKQIIGFHMPQWEECKAFVTAQAKRLPTVRYIGWDVVLKPDNTFCLIEANDNADHDFQQMYNRGLWQEYKTIIRRLKNN